MKKRFDNLFIPTCNTIFERARFNCRVQEEGESVDADLYTLADHCNYKDLHDNLIRDRIVVGIRDSQLYEWMQMDSKLTLASAIALVHQKEVVKCQQKNSGTQHRSLEQSRSLELRAADQAKTKLVLSVAEASLMITNNVLHKSWFVENARNRVIFRWYADPRANVSGLQSRKLSQEDNAFMGALKGKKQPTEQWEVILKVNSRPVKFHIDTGAEVTVVSTRTWQKIGKPSLSASDRTLRCPDEHTLKAFSHLIWFECKEFTFTRCASNAN